MRPNPDPRPPPRLLCTSRTMRMNVPRSPSQHPSAIRIQPATRNFWSCFNQHRLLKIAVIYLGNVYMRANTNLRTMVLESLRADILSRRIPSGHVLLEKEVASRLSVSKTPVREALALLCQENLVQLFPQRGYLVRELGLQEVLDTFDLRIILEGAAAEWAAIQLSAGELDTIDELCEHDYCSPAGAKRHDEGIEHSLEFHLLIARGSRNRLLAADIERLLRSSRRITAIGFTYGEHAGIVEALRSRDPSASRKAMEDHILAGRRLALQSLERGPS